MCQLKQSIKENHLIKFSWLKRSCAGKDEALHQVMAKLRWNVMDQDRCGVRKQSRELHYQDASCDNFCGWSSQSLHRVLCGSAVFSDAQGRKENHGMLTSANIVKSGLGRIVRNCSEWGKSWWMKCNTNSCKVTSIRGKALCASYTVQNMDSVSIASGNALLWSFQEGRRSTLVWDEKRKASPAHLSQ